MALRRGHAFWGLLWLVMFAVALSVNLVTFPSYEKVQCEQKSDPRAIVVGHEPASSSRRSVCVWAANVTVTQESAKFDTEARTKRVPCNEDATVVVRQCWLSESNDTFIPIDMEDAGEYEQAALVFSRLRLAFIVFAVFFASFFLYVVLRSFDARLFSQCHSAFSSRNDAHSTSDNDPHVRRPSSNFSVPNSRQDIIVPSSTLQYRITLFIQQHSMTADQVTQLRDEQWTCCVCLEQIAETLRLPHVVRLRCSHAIHAECLRMWLSKGRAVCCICNAPVFSGSVVDCSDSLALSSPSLIDSRPPDSLIVEITEYSPSSPATSDVVQMSQPQFDASPVQPNSARDDNSLATV